MESSLTDGELTILGLIAERPRHGFDIERVIEQRGIRNWTSLGFSSIYYAIGKLASRGLLEPVDPSVTGKARSPYRLTEAGHRQMVEASLEALGVPLPSRPRVLVGVANSDGLRPEALVAKLAERRDALTEQLDAVAQTRQDQGPLPQSADLIFDYSETMLRADLAWTQAALGRITKEFTMDKYDVKKAQKNLYSPTALGFSAVTVPTMQYLAVDGHGDPNTAQEYADAIEALFSVAYTLKFESKASLGRDFVVGPLEALWSATDMATFVSRDKSAWDWTAMINQPEWISEELVAAAVAKARAKKSNPALDLLRLITLDEGECIQILHVGSYDDEAPTLEVLHDSYMPENSLTFNGRHHEIYLSDARRTEPSKLKTLLRQPVRAN